MNCVTPERLGLVLATLCSLASCDSSGPEGDAGPGIDSGPAADAGSALDGGPGTADAGPGLADAGAGRCAATDPEVVQFTTDDGLDLTGDLYLSGETGGASVVLLHMIPPANDRTNYPRSFIDALVTRCVTVLNIDRRGAGDSEGDPMEAYVGPNGALDAKGAIEFLLAHASTPDPMRTAVVGASNGTTTALDFTVFAEMARTVELPAAVVMLSGGSYTENQNLVGGGPLAMVPTLFAYPESERAWNESLMAGAPATWAFREYTPGAHGTGLFGANPASIVDVAVFLEARLMP